MLCGVWYVVVNDYVGEWEGPAPCVLVPTRGVVPPCGPPAVLCPRPVVGACPVCCPPPLPLRWVLSLFPRVLVPPRGVGVLTPIIDHVCLELKHQRHVVCIRSLHGYTTAGAATPTCPWAVMWQEGWNGALRHPQPQQAFSHQHQQSSGAASHSRGHSSAIPTPTDYVCMYVCKIRRHQHTRARTRAHSTQARGATPELRRVTDTTSHGLSAGRHSTQTTIGSPIFCVVDQGERGGGQQQENF